MSADPTMEQSRRSRAGQQETPGGRRPRRPRPAWQRPGLLAAVAVGGLIGAPLRYELGGALPPRPGAFPLATFAINVSGSLVLGALLTLIVERWPPNEYLRPFLATGILGAYTTWSTFMVDADNLVREGHPAMAAGYVGASLAAGLAAVYTGMVLGRAWPRRRRISPGRPVR